MVPEVAGAAGDPLAAALPDALETAEAGADSLDALLAEPLDEAAALGAVLLIDEAGAAGLDED